MNYYYLLLLDLFSKVVVYFMKTNYWYKLNIKIVCTGRHVNNSSSYTYVLKGYNNTSIRMKENPTMVTENLKWTKFIINRNVLKVNQ